MSCTTSTIQYVYDSGSHLYVASYDYYDCYSGFTSVYNTDPDSGASDLICAQDGQPLNVYIGTVNPSHSDCSPPPAPVPAQSRTLTLYDPRRKQEK